MAEIVRMPKLSDTMTEGVVAEWHKKVGDTVESGELLAEIETDKATMEFESFQDGVLLHIGVEKGAAAPVDSILAILGESGENVEELLKQEAEKQPEAPKEEPKETEAAPTVEQNGSPQPAPVVAPTVQKEAPKTPIKKRTEVIVPSGDDDDRIKASPLARRLAREKGVNLGAIQGSGDNGRIIKRDVDNFNPGISTPSFVGNEQFYEEEVSQMRKTIARRLAESKFSAPHFYLTIEINMDKIADARTTINEVATSKVSFNDMIIKAVALSLKRHPKVNASWLEDRIRINEHVNIGVAVAVEDGLLVPVVRFADGKTLTKIGKEVKELATMARNKKLQPEHWEGSTFTISNLGMFGIEEFTAIINPPDACILAVGGIREVPVVSNGQLVPGKVMKVTMSCDHRVVDGATGAAFLATLKQYIENPVILLGEHSI